jgi:hypothetical protein
MFDALFGKEDRSGAMDEAPKPPVPQQTPPGLNPPY